MKWIDVNDELPDKRHIKLRTQFLVKGYFQIGESKGDVHCDTARLCDYLPEDYPATLEERVNFITTHWIEIELTPNTSD